MYQLLYRIITLIIVIHTVKCQETGVNLRAQSMATTNLLPQDSKVQSVQCPMWFFYNSTTGQCECYSDKNNVLLNFYPETVKCIKQRAFLKYNYYMTHSSKKGIFLSYVFYYDTSGFIEPTSQPGYIELPRNISDLNKYMCGPANRKGILCSECIDGFGPSATSPKFKCSNCTNAFATYGIVIYLLSELIPVTVFYFILYVLQVNLTSAPMISFIFHSQMIYNAMNYHVVDPADQMKGFLSIVSLFHGIWNLSFFRYIIPPFCLSPKLQIVHIIYLQSISTVFPFILIGMTWIFMELHSRNCVILVWLWRVLNKLVFKHIEARQNKVRTVIDTFATFFLLSYAKLMFVLAIPITSDGVYTINDTTLASKTFHKPTLDPSEKLFHKSHLVPILVISILIYLTTILPPVLLLALYPFRCFRSLLFKCCSSRCMASLAIFVEKFYSCYRDGLDGGRDMRSCASLPFIVVVLGFALWALAGNYSYLLFSVFCLFWSLAALIIQPYKEKYTAASDAFTLANTSILSIIIYNQSESPTLNYQTALQVLGTLPMLWLVGFVIVKTFKTQLRALLDLTRRKLPCCYLLICGNRKEEGNDAQCVQHTRNFDEILPEADRLLRPEQYMGPQAGYGSIP